MLGDKGKCVAVVLWLGVQSWPQSFYVGCVGLQTLSWPLFFATRRIDTLLTVTVIQGHATGRQDHQWGGCAEALGSSMWAIRCRVAYREAAQLFRGLLRITFRSADMSIEAHVMRLSRRQCPAACFVRLGRPTTRQKCQFGAKVLTRCCCCCCRAPSCTFTSADMNIEAHVKRLCRQQCCTACFLCLVRLITLENYEFTRKTGHM